MDFNSNLILYRIFFVVGVISLLGTLATTLEGRAHWIWWGFGIFCLFASLEFFLRHRKDTAIAAKNKESDEERLKKKIWEAELP